MPTPQKVKCVVSAVTPHGDRVYSVDLRPERAVPRFRAGQFLHLALDPYDPAGFWPESRVFSIASSPSARGHLGLTYAVHGSFTSRMEAELREGRDVWIKLPYGSFVVEPDREVVLCAGGTGMTAFTAFLEQLGPTDRSAVTVAYGARHARLLVYRDLIERCARRATSLTRLYFVEDDDAGDVGMATFSGRISIENIWPLLEQPLHAKYYLCGPPGMLNALGAELRSRHVAPDAIRTDAWE